MEKKLKRRQGVEGKTRSPKQEVREKRVQVKKMKVIDLMT
jgi:hypothetical protein